MQETMINNIVESLSEQTKALNKQTEALISNTLGKDCKSAIYDKISHSNDRIAKLEDTIYSSEDGREGLLKQVKEVSKKVDRLLIVMYGGGGIILFINLLPSLKIILGIK